MLSRHALSPETGVLVVGAGPVGLTAALELARRGVPCRIVDRRAEPRPGTRGCTVWQRTLEVFDLMGLPVEEYQASGVRYTHRAHHFAGNPAFVHDMSAPATAHPNPLLIGQGQTEHLLAARLAEYGVQVERGTTVTSVEQDDDGVTAELARADGTAGRVGADRIRAAWVVAAQGPHSTVRDGQGAGLDTVHFPGTQLLQVDARATGALPGDPAHCHLFMSEAGSLGIAPLPDGRRRFYAGVADPDLSVTGDPPLAEVLAAARSVTGVADLEFHEARFHWRVRLRNSIAGSYRVGRCLLAGDTAHTCMPVTAQGMNTGIQDAFNLGWKLAAVVRGRAPQSLLDSYQAERRPVALALAERTARTYWGGVGPRPDFDRLYSGLGRIGLGHTGLTLTYPDSPAVGHGAAGERQPFAAGGTLQRLLRRGDWLLLAVPDPSQPDAAAKAVAAAGRRPDVHAVLAEPAADPDGELRSAAFGLAGADGPAGPDGGAGGALRLIRPDGRVAFRGTASDGARLEQQLADVLG